MILEQGVAGKCRWCGLIHASVYVVVTDGGTALRCRTHTGCRQRAVLSRTWFALRWAA